MMEVLYKLVPEHLPHLCNFKSIQQGQDSLMTRTPERRTILESSPTFIMAAPGVALPPPPQNPVVYSDIATAVDYVRQLNDGRIGNFPGHPATAHEVGVAECVLCCGSWSNSCCTAMGAGNAGKHQPTVCECQPTIGEHHECHYSNAE